jgi:acyl-coenzyme A thioesterase PaaI-like protein
MPFQKAIERPGGIVSGSVFMTAADLAMWLAIMKSISTHTTGFLPDRIEPENTSNLRIGSA